MILGRQETVVIVMFSYLYTYVQKSRQNLITERDLYVSINHLTIMVPTGRHRICLLLISVSHLLQRFVDLQLTKTECRSG